MLRFVGKNLLNQTKGFHSSALRLAEENAAAASANGNKVLLNLNSPSEAIYAQTPVDLVQIPGAVGEYGVTAGHTPIIAQLKPGVIAVHHETGSKVERFFTSGGFAFTHDNNVTDLACVELVRVEDLDASSAADGLAKYKAEMEAAAEGSEQRFEAQVAFETHQAMVNALAATN